VPPFSSAIAVASIERAFNRPVDEIFETFDREPVASASIAQVHFATLRGKSGHVREVAVKVLRPGMLPVIDKDLSLMRMMAGWVGNLSADGKRLKPREVVAEFDNYLHDELDLVREAANAAQLRRNMQGLDLVLIPEVPIALEGDTGVFACIERVLERRGHAVIVTAEGTAQDLIDEPLTGEKNDKSGNARLKDIGVFLRDRIDAHFKSRGRETTIKYIDPSYAIRSVPACPSDSVFCWNMARNAVHAAMAGNTAMLIGRWHGRFVHVPMTLTSRRSLRVDPEGDLWMSVIEATGQPRTLS
jgi:hypothetical protein